MAFYLSTQLNVPALQSKYLARDGSNYMMRELQGVAGTNDFPSFCFRGDNKTGIYWHSQGVIGFSSLGWSNFLFTNKKLTFLDRNRKKLNLTFDSLTEAETTLKLPTDQDGGTLTTTTKVNELIRSSQLLNKVNNELITINALSVVKLDGDTGMLLALADDPENYGIGLVVADVDTTLEGDILLSGSLQNADWTDIVGTTTLVTGTRYYLSDTDPGKLVDVAPSNAQLIGIAINTDELLLKIQ